MNTEKKSHWEHIFETKDTTKVSWYQPVPETSLKLIKKLNLHAGADIIEIGSGDSFLADFLVDEGFKLTLLDIAEKALLTIKNRLGEKSAGIQFIASNVLDFKPHKQFNLWHDRAVFHFLGNETEIAAYLKIVADSVIPGGYVILSTFSENGPDQCSGLQVSRYSAKKLEKLFATDFELSESFTEDHTTPSGNRQNFVFCVFRRK